MCHSRNDSFLRLSGFRASFLYFNGRPSSFSEIVHGQNCDFHGEEILYLQFRLVLYEAEEQESKGRRSTWQRKNLLTSWINKSVEDAERDKYMLSNRDVPMLSAAATFFFYVTYEGLANAQCGSCFTACRLIV